MKQINIENGQNLVDIAMQEHGTPEALVTICKDNALEYDADLSTIQTLVIREPGIDVIPYHNAAVVAEYKRNNIVVNSHTDRALRSISHSALPCFYGSGAYGLDEAGIKLLAVVYKSTRLASLKFTANTERLYYVYPIAQGALVNAFDPSGFDVLPLFEERGINITIDGNLVPYYVRTLEHDTYLTSADNFIIDFK